MAKVGVGGTTSWGTTLAIIAARQGLDVTLWTRTEEEASELKDSGQNYRVLPNAHFPASLKVTSSKEDTFSNADLIILAVPSSSLRSNTQAIHEFITQNTVIVSATKGLEAASSKRMSQILQDELSPSLHPGICALSGPNLAKEIVNGKPSSTVIASSNKEASKYAQSLLTSQRFRVYTNTDIIGVEFGGALKNVIALGAGICDGLSYGDNAKSSFMTRGLAEITRLAVSAGANPATLAGLAGIGDLVATCSSTLSRNHYLGEELAKGRSLTEILHKMKHVAEGVDTTVASLNLAQSTGIHMPITQATYNVLFDNLPIEQAISQLMGRPPIQE